MYKAEIQLHLTKQEVEFLDGGPENYHTKFMICLYNIRVNGIYRWTEIFRAGNFFHFYTVACIKRSQETHPKRKSRLLVIYNG